MSLIRAAAKLATGTTPEQLLNPARYATPEEYTRSLIRLCQAGRLELSEKQLAAEDRRAELVFAERVEGQRVAAERLQRAQDNRELAQDAEDAVYARVMAINGTNDFPLDLPEPELTEGGYIAPQGGPLR